jgi:hypothetical protein
MKHLTLQSQKLVDARQPSGRWEPVFPVLLAKEKLAKEEEYITRMIKRDREMDGTP